MLVPQALRHLDPQSDDRVIDWFCGLGNFTLAIARGAREVLGIEGSETLVAARARQRRRNGLAERARFEARDLFDLERAASGGVGRGRSLAGRSAARRRVRAGQGGG